MSLFHNVLRSSAEHLREQSGLATSTAAESAMQDQNTGAASTTLTMGRNTQLADGSRPAADAANHPALFYGSTASNRPTSNVHATLDIARYLSSAPADGTRGSWRGTSSVTYNTGGVTSLASVTIGIERVNIASPSHTSAPAHEVERCPPSIHPSAGSSATEYPLFGSAPKEPQISQESQRAFARQCRRNRSRRFAALDLADNILHRREKKRKPDRFKRSQSSEAVLQTHRTLDDNDTLPDYPSAPHMSRAQSVERNSSYTLGRGPPLVEQSAGSSAGNLVVENPDPRVPRLLSGRGTQNPRPHEENRSLKGRGICKSSATSQKRRFQ